MALSTIYTEICYAHILWIRPIDCINHDRSYSSLTYKEIFIEFGWEHLLCVGKHDWPFVPSDLVWVSPSLCGSSKLWPESQPKPRTLTAYSSEAEI